MRLEKRLRDLEAKGRPVRPEWARWHQILMAADSSEDAAIDAYGRDRIAEGDNILLIQVFAPKYGADGQIIPPASSGPKRTERV